MILQQKPTKGTPIFCGRHVVGEVQNGIFKKSIEFSKHALRTPPGLAFDVSTLDDAEKSGAGSVEVTDRESGRIYRASIATIRAHGFAVNRGFGAQIALALAWWSIDGKPPTGGPAKPQPAPQGKQLSLFGG